MLNNDLRKIYKFYPIEPAPAAGALPTGGDVYYECLDCTAIINSMPHIPSACVCGNLQGNGGKVEIKLEERVRAVKGKLK